MPTILHDDGATQQPDRRPLTYPLARSNNRWIEVGSSVRMSDEDSTPPVPADRSQNHAAGPLGQSRLDGPIQILNDRIEPAGDLKDLNSTHGVRPDPYWPVQGRTAAWLRWECGRRVVRGPVASASTRRPTSVEKLWGSVEKSGGLPNGCAIANSIRGPGRYKARAGGPLAQTSSPTSTIASATTLKLALQWRARARISWYA
jgi:hypothetical protein